MVQEIGPLVEEFLPQGILIFFDQPAPAGLGEVSPVHDGAGLPAPIAVGDLQRFSEPAPGGGRRRSPATA
ncbi:PTS glucitol/sorbitol transporter subunit IIA [Thermogemmatispora sp.]|uniref:PTS glucitol/sorbitol transporter subunit IIA n=1 Tax=Thermogemmatispora sp. TaxID=1968838 RepID=UPI0035E41EC2